MLMFTVQEDVVLNPKRCGRPVLMADKEQGKKTMQNANN